MNRLITILIIVLTLWGLKELVGTGAVSIGRGAKGWKG
jgi:hypothetical protein